mgnify:FL=1|jgi:hypothetical protein
MKQVFFKLKLSGNGCVNFDDSAKQAELLSKLGILNGKTTGNIKLAKKVISDTGKKDEKGNPIYDYKVKISADCLRHHTFEHEVDVVTPAVQMLDTMYCNYLLSNVGITRGYMFALSSDVGKSLKRKSPLTIVDAIQTNGAKSQMFEVGTTSGPRTYTSLFSCEKVGEIEYSTHGVIDLKTLSFISADEKFDRMGLYTEWIDNGLIDKVMKSHYGENAQYETGFFVSNAKYLTNTFAECGVHLGDNVVTQLVRYILRSLLGIDIRRNNAWARAVSLEVKIVNNPLEDTFNDESDWKQVDEDYIDSLEIKCDDFYHKATEEETKELVEINEKYLQNSNDKKAAKEKKKEEKRQKQAAKEAEKEAAAKAEAEASEDGE